MNSERDDRKLSAAYREMADETTPAELDRAIMSAAQKEARTRYGLARAWIRPLAWAATIALSFAFILEMTYFDEAPPVIDEAPSAIDEATPATEAGRADFDPEPATLEESAKRTRAPVVAAPEFKVEDASMLREAAEMSDDGSLCDATARQAADTWYACIVELREQGLHEAAGAELERLRGAYPDFELPISE